MKVVSTSNAPAAIGPYSQAIDLGNMVFVSGQIPVDPATGKMADTVEEQAAQSLANLKAILAEAGLSMANVVKTVIFLADINDFAAVNAVYAKAFAEPFPARSCAGGRHSQGRKAGDRVHRRARIIRPKHKRGCATGTAPFACMRKNEKSNYGRRPMPPSSVRVSPDRYLKSGMASCTHTRPISVSGLA